MRTISSPQSRLDLGLGQANSLELDLGLEKGALADLCYTYTLVWYRSSPVKVTGATNGKMGYMFFLFRFRNKTTFYLQAKLLVIQKST